MLYYLKEKLDAALTFMLVAEAALSVSVYSSDYEPIHRSQHLRTNSENESWVNTQIKAQRQESMNKTLKGKVMQCNATGQRDSDFVGTLADLNFWHLVRYPERIYMRTVH